VDLWSKHGICLHC